MAVAPVLFCGGGNRALVTRPVQFYDLMGSHCALPSLCVKAFHLYRQQKSPFIAWAEKTFPNLSYHAGAAISTGLRPRITAWALKKLMQSTHIYRASGVVGYKRKKYAAYDKGRAELPEPDFACRSFRSYQNLVRERCPQTLLYANSPAPPPYEDR